MLVKNRNIISNICYFIAFAETDYDFSRMMNLLKPDNCTANTIFTQGSRININKITSDKFIENNKRITSECSRFTGNEDSIKNLTGDDFKKEKNNIINNYKMNFVNKFYGNHKESNHWDEWGKPCDFKLEQVGNVIKGKKRSAILLKITFTDN